MICRGLEQLRDHTVTGWLWFPVARHTSVVFLFCCFRCVHFSAISKVPLHITARRPIPLLPKQCKRENSCKLNHLRAARLEVARWWLDFIRPLCPLPSFSACFYINLRADLVRCVKHHPPRSCFKDKPKAGSPKSHTAFHLQSLGTPFWPFLY